ncbi:MAG: hypothetical protein M0P31_06785 [Solirubrobacteraceae bacterium]|nr:hypothetical protein [Solirubrobacteraceae bacterium]
MLARVPPLTPANLARFWIPVLLIATAPVMIIISPNIIGLDGAAIMLGGGAGVWVSNKLYRIGQGGEKDRHVEVDSRAFMTRYGVWPDEASPDVLRRAVADGALSTEQATEIADRRDAAA